MIETKRLDVNFTEFTANGHKYVKNVIFPIERYEAFEILQPQLAYDLDFKAMYQQDKKMYAMANDSKFADICVMLFSRMQKIKELLDVKRTHPALLLCALAINRVDEDPTEFNEAFQLEKIEDWRKEGFAMQDFFLFAASIMKGLPSAYSEQIMEEASEEKIIIVKK